MAEPDQREAAAAGAGRPVRAAAAAVLASSAASACGAFGGGAAGWSSANTGLGSMMVVGGEAKSPGLRIDLDRNRDRLELGHREGDGEAGVGRGHAIEQGVLQAGPSEVVASAPGGADSSATCTGRRRRLEGVEGKRGAAGEGSPRRRQSR